MRNVLVTGCTSDTCPCKEECWRYEIRKLSLSKNNEDFSKYLLVVGGRKPKCDYFWPLNKGTTHG